jgi:uncharacterized protein YndB with AHSA1/START domain
MFILAPREEIWDILEDSTRLPEWTTVLRTTGVREMPGSVRECEVNFEGKMGSVVERCVDSDPYRRIEWLMDDDTFGFSRMLSDFGFSFTLTATVDGETLVRTDTYYRPKTILAKAMNRLLMKRKFRAARRRFLKGLKGLAEAGHDPAGARGRARAGGAR